MLGQFKISFHITGKYYTVDTCYNEKTYLKNVQPLKMQLTNDKLFRPGSIAGLGYFS